MAKLSCEICGGRLIMSNDGIFQCEACGSCFSKEWAKNKAQEITGTVQVEGVATVESLLKRAQEFFDSYNYETAIEYCNKILDIDPDFTAARELLKQIKETLTVKVFNVYQARVTDIYDRSCRVQLIPSGQTGTINKLYISNHPPLEDISYFISVGDILPVIVLRLDFENGHFLSARQNDLQLEHYLSSGSYDSLKETLQQNIVEKTTIDSVLGVLASVKNYWCVHSPQEQCQMLKLLVEKGLHDNPDYLDIRLFYIDALANVPEIKELRSQAKERGRILNRTFFPPLLRYFGINAASWKIYKDCGEGESYSDIQFAIKNFISLGICRGSYDQWRKLPVDLPDNATLEEWSSNYQRTKCFAGGTQRGWSGKNVVCGCRAEYDRTYNRSYFKGFGEECRFDNPRCPLHFNPYSQSDDPQS